MAALAVIVPVLDDAEAVSRLVADIPADPAVELIIVDGGNDASLQHIADNRPGTRVVRSARGRGVQMNAGASASSAPLLWFVHADSQLPAGWKRALTSLPANCAGGWFRFALDDTAWQARLLERAVAWRVALMRLPYGDQGVFVRREAFDRIGGFPPWPLMEDVAFVRRLTAAGRVEELPLALRTSARRWRRDGWIRCSARNLLLLTLYFAGVPPARLARWYAGR